MKKQLPTGVIMAILLNVSKQFSLPCGHVTSATDRDKLRGLYQLSLPVLTAYNTCASLNIARRQAMRVLGNYDVCFNLSLLLRGRHCSGSENPVKTRFWWEKNYTG